MEDHLKSDQSKECQKSCESPCALCYDLCREQALDHKGPGGLTCSQCQSQCQECISNCNHENQDHLMHMDHDHEDMDQDHHDSKHVPRMLPCRQCDNQCKLCQVRCRNKESKDDEKCQDCTAKCDECRVGCPDGEHDISKRGIPTLNHDACHEQCRSFCRKPGSGFVDHECRDCKMKCRQGGEGDQEREKRETKDVSHEACRIGCLAACKKTGKKEDCQDCYEGCKNKDETRPKRGIPSLSHEACQEQCSSLCRKLGGMNDACKDCLKVCRSGGQGLEEVHDIEKKDVAQAACRVGCLAACKKTGKKEDCQDCYEGCKNRPKRGIPSLRHKACHEQCSSACRKPGHGRKLDACRNCMDECRSGGQDLVDDHNIEKKDVVQAACRVGCLAACKKTGKKEDCQDCYEGCKNRPKRGIPTLSHEACQEQCSSLCRKPGLGVNDACRACLKECRSGGQDLVEEIEEDRTKRSLDMGRPKLDLDHIFTFPCARPCRSICFSSGSSKRCRECLNGACHSSEVGLGREKRETSHGEADPFELRHGRDHFKGDKDQHKEEKSHGKADPFELRHKKDYFKDQTDLSRTCMKQCASSCPEGFVLDASQACQDCILECTTGQQGHGREKRSEHGSEKETQQGCSQKCQKACFERFGIDAKPDCQKCLEYCATGKEGQGREKRSDYGSEKEVPEDPLYGQSVHEHGLEACRSKCQEHCSQGLGIHTPCQVCLRTCLATGHQEMGYMGQESQNAHDLPLEIEQERPAIDLAENPESHRDCKERCSMFCEKGKGQNSCTLCMKHCLFGGHTGQDEQEGQHGQEAIEQDIPQGCKKVIKLCDKSKHPKCREKCVDQALPEDNQDSGPSVRKANSCRGCKTACNLCRASCKDADKKDGPFCMNCATQCEKCTTLCDSQKEQERPKRESIQSCHEKCATATMEYVRCMSECERDSQQDQGIHEDRPKRGIPEKCEEKCANTEKHEYPSCISKCIREPHQKLDTHGMKFAILDHAGDCENRCTHHCKDGMEESPQCQQCNEKCKGSKQKNEGHHDDQNFGMSPRKASSCRGCKTNCFLCRSGCKDSDKKDGPFCQHCDQQCQKCDDLCDSRPKRESDQNHEDNQDTGPALQTAISCRGCKTACNLCRASCKDSDKGGSFCEHCDQQCQKCEDTCGTRSKRGVEYLKCRDNQCQNVCQPNKKSGNCKDCIRGCLHDQGIEPKYDGKNDYKDKSDPKTPLALHAHQHSCRACVAQCRTCIKENHEKCKGVDGQKADCVPCREQCEKCRPLCKAM